MVTPATLSLSPSLSLSLPPPRPSASPPPRHLHNYSNTRSLSSNSLSRAPVSPIRAVAVDSDQAGSSQAPQLQPQRYHFVVANAKFMLDEEEHFREQLYERLRLFGERDRPQDFWLVIEPKFLDRFPDITRRLKRPAVALVSTDANWIKFMKLRLDRVLTSSFEADTLDQALASTPVDLQFDKPQNWTAPYPKYEFGWWEPFLPPKSHNSSA